MNLCKLWLFFMLFAVTGFSSAARAQGAPMPVKPGLWETQVSVTSKMALPPEVEAKIAAMPQAQQDQMRSMMGGAMGGGQPTTATRQVCIAPQSNMDTMLNQAQQAGGMKCTFTNRVQTASSLSFDISCTGAQGSGTGHTQFSVVDEDHMNSSSHITVTASANGHTMNSTVDTTGSEKFLSADCGNVKPYTPPAK